MTRHTKWKIQPKESLTHKLNKPHAFRKFNKVEKFSIFGILLIGAFLLPAYASYQFNSGYPGTLGYHDNKDPFTTIWNGQSGAPSSLSKYTAGFPSFISSACKGGPGAGNSCTTNTRQNSFTASVTINQVQEFLLVAMYGYKHGVSGCDGFTVTDSDGNSYTFLIEDSTTKNTAFSIDNNRPFLTMSYTYAQIGPPQNLASSPWIDSVTATSNCSGANAPIWAMSVSVWTGVSGAAGTRDDAESCDVSTASHIQPSNPISCSPNAGAGISVSKNDKVIDGTFSDFNSNCPTPTVTDLNSSVVTDFVRGCDNSFAGDSAFYSQFEQSTLATKTGNYFPTMSQVLHYDTFANNATLIGISISLKPDLPASQCNPGYSCFQSKADAAGNFELFPTPTSSAYTLSIGSINLATGVSKELAWNQGFAINHTQFTPNVGVGWFMTNNGTISNSPSYNPLNDPSVVLAVMAYPQSANCQNSGAPFNADCTWNVYVYLQKNLGQTAISSSGVSENPFPSCPTSGSLYLCGQSKGNTTALQALVLNYTGNAQPLSGGQNGVSKLCAGLSVSNPSSCSVGGVGDAQINYVNGVQNLTSYTLPWLNLQNQYYLGFWTGANQRTIEYFGSGNYNVISVFVPTAATPAPPSATTDSGGFFGWLGNIIGGTFNQVGTFLAPAINPLLNFGNSLMGAIISGFAQSINLLIQAFRLVLNFIGNQLGLGNIGDLLITTVLAIGSLIVSGFSAIVSFFSAIGSLITSGYFGFLAGAAVLIATLLPAAIVLWNIIFNGAFTVNDILFADYVFGIAIVSKAIKERKSALKAFLGWISFNVFLFTFVFEAAWVIFDIVTRPIHRIKTTIDPVG